MQISVWPMVSCSVPGHTRGMSPFLVIGGTGKVGRRLARELRAAGHQARVASRSGGDVRFDWHDRDSYRPALSGTDGVFIVGPGSASDWSGPLSALLAAAQDSHVGRAVLLSARGVEFLPDGVVARAENALRQGPVPWTILRPSHFDQNFTEAMLVPAGGVVAAPVGDGAEPFVDVQDIAEVAAAVLAGDGRAGDTIGLSGPAAITFAEAVAILGERTGQALRFVSETPAAHVARLRAAGTPEGYITWRMAMLGGIARGADAYLSDGVSRVLGRPATSFATWASREAAALPAAR
jgi:uncharacterized protein YbjT (DUF2867 family)